MVVCFVVCLYACVLSCVFWYSCAFLCIWMLVCASLSFPQLQTASGLISTSCPTALIVRLCTFLCVSYLCALYCVFDTCVLYTCVRLMSTLCPDCSATNQKCVSTNCSNAEAAPILVLQYCPCLEWSLQCLEYYFKCEHQESVQKILGIFWW